MSKIKYPRITTPRGVLVYPHLVEPDTKFVKPDGEYHTKLALEADSNEATALVTQLDAILGAYIDQTIADAENPKAAKKLKTSQTAALYEEEVDDEGEETGRWIFKFKLKAKVKTKTKEWDQKPRLFDGQANPITGDVNPWTGSEGKISAEVFPYYMETTKSFGLSLRCQAVQILKLVAGTGGGNAEGFGFGAEDDSYVTEATGEGFTPESGDEDGDEF
jgi:hypothetical protein